MTSRWSTGTAPRGEEYDDRFAKLQAAGHDVHGEASFVAAYGAQRVLDAGCGTGRVTIELERRGIHTVGVDLDEAMLSAARTKAPDLTWYRGDISRLDLRDESGKRVRFQLVLTAGNVMIFLDPGSEARTVARLAAHLVPGGLLVAGFQLTAGRYGLRDYDEACAAAGLDLYERFSSWTRDRWEGSGGYAVSVHQKPVPPPEPAPAPEVSGSVEESAAGHPANGPVATPAGDRPRDEYF